MKILLLILMVTFLTATGWTQPVSGLVDPLRPSHYQPRPQTEQRQEQESLEKFRDQFRVTAILRSSDRSVAVINGRPLQIGQVIGDFRLIDIGPDQVVLQKGQQKLTLYRSVSEVQKSPATDGITP